MKNLNSLELEIIAARKKGKALCDLNEDEFNAALTGIIFNISVICGCQLPTHEAHINALEKEFSIFLMDNGYHSLTPEEVLSAFRMHSNFKFDEKYEMYGALFNIDFASKVMRHYLRKRLGLDDRLVFIVEEADREKLMKEFDDKRRIKVKTQFSSFLSGEVEKLDLSDCYMQLAHDGAFSNQGEIMKLWNSLDNYGAAMISSLLKPGEKDDELDKMFEIQKRIVLYLFKQMKVAGKLEVYDEQLKLIHPGFVFPVAEVREKLKNEN